MKKRVACCVCGILFGSVCHATDIVPVTYTWTNSMTAAAFSPGHWDVTPDFDSGAGVYKFNGIDISSTRNFTLNTDVNAYGLYLGSLSGGQTANIVTDGTHGIHLGAGGLALTNAIRYWAVQAPIYVEEDQTWSSAGRVAGSGYGVYVIGGLLDGANGPKTITKVGQNAMWLRHNDDTDFSGTFVVEEGSVYLQGNKPLGTDSTLVITNGNASAQALFYGMSPGTLANPVVVNIGSERSATTASSAAIGIMTDKNSQEGAYGISGPITYSGTSDRLLLSGTHDNVLTLSGGLSGTAGVRISFAKPNGQLGTVPGLIVVTNLPWISTSYILPAAGVDLNGDRTADGTYGTIEFAVAGNRFKSWGSSANGTFASYMNLKTSVDRVFDSDSQNVYIGNCSVWDLCGTSQRIGGLYLCHTAFRLPVILNSSDVPATLYCTQSDSWTHAGSFSGKIDLVLAGTGGHVITNVCDVTGDIDLQGADMEFTKEGKWTGLRNLSVASGSAMTVSAADQLGSEVRLKILSGGKFVTPSDTVVTQEVAALVLDGIVQAPGLYSAQSYEGVTCESGYFEGAGVINVRSYYVETEDGVISLGENASMTIASNSALSEPVTNVNLAAGSTLTVADSAFFGVGVADFVLAEGSRLTISGGSALAVKSFVVGGTPLYGTLTWAGNPDKDPCAVETSALGEGMSVFVPRPALASTSTVEWTGAGADKLMDTAENWSAPANLSDGTMAAVFPAGSEAVADETAFFNGMTFTQTSAFAVSATDDASIGLASGGVTVSGSGAVTLSAPVRIETDQTWDLTGNLTVNGAIGSDPLSDYTITKTGTGALTIDSDDSSYTGSLTIEEGDLTLKGDDPLGAGDGVLIMKYKNLRLYNTIVNKKLVLSPTETVYTDRHVFASEGTSYINGPVEIGYGKSINLGFAPDSSDRHYVFAGGLTGHGSVFFRGRANVYGTCSLLITNKPWSLNGLFRPVGDSTDSNGRCGHVIFAVSGNKFARLGENSEYTFWNGCYLSTTVDGAITSDTPVFFGNNSIWDLCGTSQHIGHFRTRWTNGSRPVVTNSSERTATFEFTQAEDYLNVGVFAGDIDIVMNGAKTLTNDCAMASTGSITLNGASLVFIGDGSWKTAESLTVNGNSRVTIANSHTFGKKVEMTLASSDSLTLASGVRQRVARLTVGTVEYTTGEFTFGEGTVDVGPEGLKIILK